MLRPHGLFLGLTLLGTGCGRTDLMAEFPGTETDSTTVSMEDTGRPEEGEEDVTDDWGESGTEWGEESGEWGESGTSWGESGTEWGEETWGESGTEWGESGTEWGEETWGESGTDTSTTDTGTETTGTTDTGTTDTGTTDTGTTDTDTGGGQSCSEATACLVDCGDYSPMCIQPCTDGLMGPDQQDFFALQICALQSCFFAGECGFDFNAPECVKCRLDASSNPDQWGCGPEGQACGI